MSSERVIKVNELADSRPGQLSFDELAALRASDEANANAVIGEILSLSVDA